MAFEVYNPKQTKSRMFNVLNKNLKQRLEVLKKLVLEDFKKAVWINLYVKYSPKIYQRTYSLLESISVSDVIQAGNSLSFQIYFDKQKLDHFSVVSGEKSYNGKDIYTPPLLDESHTQEGYEGTKDMFHDYPARNFIEEAIIFIESDLRKTLKTIIKSEVKKMGGKNKY